jgi:hypothetical protein
MRPHLRHDTKKEHKKRNLNFLRFLFLFNLAVPAFPGRRQPSIIGAEILTSVFGMGTGVSFQLYPPEIFNVYEYKNSLPVNFTCD